MSTDRYVKPRERAFADAIFQVQGGLPHKILHQGVLSFLREERIADSEVLEAGCGAGGFTRKLSKLQPARITAGDVNEDMLVRGRSRVRKKGVEFVPLDLSKALPLENDSFDWVVCISVLMHLAPEVSSLAIGEFARVTRPGGKVLMAVLNTDWAESLYEAAPAEGRYARRVPAGDSSIREYYPPAEHYLMAFTSAGMQCERHEIRVPEEGAVAGPPYDQRIGDPVWTMYVASQLTNS